MVELWQGLTEIQQTIILVAAVVAIVGGGFSVLYAYAGRGVDFSGFGDWLRSWFD